MLLPFMSTFIYILIGFILNFYREYLFNLYNSNQIYKKNLKNISIIHNLGLVIFSFYTFITLKNMLLLKYNTINPLIFLQDKTLDYSSEYIFWYFTYSKIWEFFDTYLLQLRGIEPLFLQKFHHFGAVWVWYYSVYTQANSVILATLFNSFVHTIMYLYYLMTLFGYKLNSIKFIITTIQIIQLIVGNIITILYYLPGLEYSNPKFITNILFIIYVVILIVLFVNFFILTYISKIQKIQ